MKKIYIDTTKNNSARSYMSLSIYPVADKIMQKYIIEQFNILLNFYRDKYNSLFLTNYRESNTIARKRISFDLIYTLVNHIIYKYTTND